MDTTHAAAARLPSQPRITVATFPARGRSQARSTYSGRAISRPASEFTGDFYFTTRIDEILWFALGDFVGHGLHSAVYMAMVQEELERIIRSRTSMTPAQVVVSLDDTLREILPVNRFATLVVGRARQDGSIDIVNAGHSYPMVMRSDGTIEWINPHGPVVGIIPSARWEHESILLRSGDKLVLYTDGIEEARRQGNSHAAGEMGELLASLGRA